MTEIAERLEDSRLTQGLTQTQLAERLGLTQSAVANYVSRPNMNVTTLIRWAAALGMQIVLVPASMATQAEEMNR